MYKNDMGVYCRGTAPNGSYVNDHGIVCNNSNPSNNYSPPSMSDYSGGCAGLLMYGKPNCKKCGFCDKIDKLEKKGKKFDFDKMLKMRVAAG